MNQKRLGEILDFLRRRAGLSIQGLANKSGMARQSCHNILRGNNLQRIDSIDKICGSLGVPAEAVFALASEIEKGSPYHGPFKKLKEEICRHLGECYGNPENSDAPGGFHPPGDQTESQGDG